MKIDGRAIAEDILDTLRPSITLLAKRSIVPTMAVILIGDNPNSLSYINQKKKTAEKIGAKVVVEQFPDTISPTVLESTIAHYNHDTSIHGCIVQRPVPTFIGDVGNMLDTISPQKDIDGFVPNSPYEVPVAMAVYTILTDIHTRLRTAKLTDLFFTEWLKEQAIVILGRGETAGKPIASMLENMHCATSIIYSKTLHPKDILKHATVIISCVGKQHIITKNVITKGAILIGVGMNKDANAHIIGDYEEKDIQKQTSFYTPTPGGVGPVNVACLMKNLVNATLLETASL